MLTVKNLQDKKDVLLRRGGAIYVVWDDTKIAVWVNSMGYNTVAMSAEVIEMLDEGSLRYDKVYYRKLNREMSLQAFCDAVNGEYGYLEVGT